MNGNLSEPVERSTGSLQHVGQKRSTSLARAGL